MDNKDPQTAAEILAHYLAYALAMKGSRNAKVARDLSKFVEEHMGQLKGIHHLAARAGSLMALISAVNKQVPEPQEKTAGDKKEMDESVSDALIQELSAFLVDYGVVITLSTMGKVSAKSAEALETKLDHILMPLRSKAVSLFNKFTLDGKISSSIAAFVKQLINQGDEAIGNIEEVAFKGMSKEEIKAIEEMAKGEDPEEAVSNLREKQAGDPAANPEEGSRFKMDEVLADMTAIMWYLLSKEGASDAGKILDANVLPWLQQKSAAIRAKKPMERNISATKRVLEEVLGRIKEREQAGSGKQAREVLPEDSMKPSDQIIIHKYASGEKPDAFAMSLFNSRETEIQSPQNYHHEVQDFMGKHANDDSIEMGGNSDPLSSIL